MFKHSHLFSSAAPGGSGYESEQRVRDNNGVESERVKFAPGCNTWDLAKKYSEKKGRAKFPILLWVGTKGFNYEANLKFGKFLQELEIPHSKLIIKGAKHSASQVYEMRGLDLMKFHQRNFAESSSN
jgi:endo-1,4-beta-xylanase